MREDFKSLTYQFYVNIADMNLMNSGSPPMSRSNLNLLSIKFVHKMRRAIEPIYRWGKSPVRKPALTFALVFWSDSLRLQSCQLKKFLSLTRSLDRFLTISLPSSAEDRANWDAQGIRFMALHIGQTSIKSEIKDDLQRVEFGKRIGFSLMISSELRG